LEKGNGCEEEVFFYKIDEYLQANHCKRWFACFLGAGIQQMVSQAGTVIMFSRLRLPGDFAGKQRRFSKREGQTNGRSYKR
jgi:hypothetical protein